MPRYHAPLDPECPEVKAYKKMLAEDEIGKPVHDDMWEDFEHKHRASCKRCQEYGAANIEIV